MRIRRVSILASLCTLANAVCGFAAITLTAKALLASDVAHATFQTQIRLAGSFIILAMVLDALDGRLARFARVTSDFGGQLDSLCDAVSFGVAPAFLMNRVVVEGLQDVDLPFGAGRVLWLAWVCGAVYLGCALIRLARFNVENVHDEEAHLSFRGLPSPPAAGALVSLIIVLAGCWSQVQPDRTACAMLWALPVVAVVLGLLMVSRVRYSHLLNQFLRGRRPLSHLVLLLLAIALAFLLREVMLPVGFGAYALSGPVMHAYRRLGGPRGPKAAERPGPAAPPVAESSPQHKET
ncbi:MAG: phosphatidylcholine/phosphatidylserine synthase [Planctomycetes bacterium]|nr:phosphatidylcholine/phosphatidylserine synthase [Planctomycetota bacterium]